MVWHLRRSWSSGVVVDALINGSPRLARLTAFFSERLVLLALAMAKKFSLGVSAVVNESERRSLGFLDGALLPYPDRHRITRSSGVPGAFLGFHPQLIPRLTEGLLLRCTRFSAAIRCASSSSLKCMFSPNGRRMEMGPGSR